MPAQSRTGASYPDISNELRRARRPAPCGAASRARARRARRRRRRDAHRRRRRAQRPARPARRRYRPRDHRDAGRSCAARAKKPASRWRRQARSWHGDAWSSTARPSRSRRLREDVETDGRRAKVRFGRDFDADALRRDFTINALSLDARGRLHDPSADGPILPRAACASLATRAQRIAEDYLRILRFFRFSAAYGAGRSTPKVWRPRRSARRPRNAVARTAGRGNAQTAGRPARRLRRRTHGACRPVRLFRRRALAGAAEKSARGRRARRRTDGPCGAGPAQRKRRRASGRNPAALQRPKTPAAGAAKAAAFWHGASAAPAPAALREALFHFGPEAARDGLELIRAEAGAPRTIQVSRARSFSARHAAAEAAFRRRRSFCTRRRQGAGVGAALKRLQALWIRAGFPSDPQNVARLIEQACGRAKIPAGRARALEQDARTIRRNAWALISFKSPRFRKAEGHGDQQQTSRRTGRTHGAALPARRTASRRRLAPGILHPA